jgi:Ca2+:H+ antiporter
MGLEEEDEDMDEIDRYSIISKEMTVKDRQETLNEIHPFGIRLWKAALYKKTRGIDRVTEEALHSDPFENQNNYANLGNLLWFSLFGWWMSIVYVILGVSLYLAGAKKYSELLINIAGYVLWPFGKYVEKSVVSSLEEHQSLLRNSMASLEEDLDNRWEGQSTYAYDEKKAFIPFVLKHIAMFNMNGLLYYLLLVFVIIPIHFFVAVICWFSIFAVPMARLNAVLIQYLFYFPLMIRAKPIGVPVNGEAVLCSNKAVGLQYYKYTYDGVNIILLNLLVFVFFALIDGYFIAPHHETGIGHPIAVFVLCILSIIPLAYYIGMAVSSIGAQSSLGMAAVINATFGSIVEIILYALALKQKKSTLVEGAIVGSFLGTLLLLPGLSMIAGGINRKHQRFNSRSTGVSSSMLIFSMIGAFTPTLFYSIYGKVDIKCADKEHGTSCSRVPTDISNDSFFNENMKPLMYICAAILPTMYCIGLWFTLRTHVSHIYNDKRRQSQFTSDILSHDDLLEDKHPAELHEEHTFSTPAENHGGHDAPNWSKAKSVVILLVSTVLFSLLAGKKLVFKLM